jgi:hypothetical protein
MSLPDPAILDTILGHLALHFLAATNGDHAAARHAASCMLACHDPQTGEEIHLATGIVSFGFHALEALSAAAAPELSLNQKIRLRGSAVSMSREAHRARRKLDQLKRARLTASVQAPDAPEAQTPVAQTPLAQTQATPDESATGKALGLIEFAKEALQASTKKGGVQALSLSRRQRRAAEQITKNLRRNSAEHACREAAVVVVPSVAATARAPVADAACA